MVSIRGLDMYRSKKILLSIKALVAVACLFSCINPQGAIVILNGTSTSGKSSITKNVKKNIQNCVDISIDAITINLIAEVIENNIKKQLDQKAINLLVSRDIVTKETTESGTTYRLPRNNIALLGKKLGLMEKIMPDFEYLTAAEQTKCEIRADKVLAEKAIQLSEEGKTVIIDTVVANKSERRTYEESFRGRNLYFILVYCPLATLVSRTRARNEAAKKAGLSLAEERELEVPLEQFLQLYVVPKNPSDNQLLTYLKNPEDAVISYEMFTTILDSNRDLFDKESNIDEVKKMVRKQWKLHERKSVTIAPELKYHLIVDNGKDSAAAKCAKQIQEFLDSEKAKKQPVTHTTAWQRFWDFVLRRGK